ncbi:OB-fold nucleic acid binding domain-containing protein [Nanoarchaeota archaeon]
MFKIPLDEVKTQIRKEAHLTDEELNSRIKQKMDQLSGLISEEGAAHIIANELKVNLNEGTEGKIKIKKIYVGMRNVETVGKVMKKYELRTFQTENRSGQVGSFMIGDETGMIRIVLWNDQADQLNNFSEGDVVKIKSGYVRENRGFKEVHLNDKSSLSINPEGEQVGEVKETREAERKQIKDLTENDQNAELLGTIVQVFDLRFFTVCPECGKRVYERENTFECGAHGKVAASYSYVMNVFLDDGTDNIRVVFWKSQTENLLKKTEAEILTYKDELQKFEEVKNDLLGTIIKMVGRVNKNEMFDRLEFNAQLVFPEPDPEEELKKLDN